SAYPTREVPRLTIAAIVQAVKYPLRLRSGTGPRSCLCHWRLDLDIPDIASLDSSHGPMTEQAIGADRGPGALAIERMIGGERLLPLFPRPENGFRHVFRCILSLTLAGAQR